MTTKASPEVGRKNLIPTRAVLALIVALLTALASTDAQAPLEKGRVGVTGDKNTITIENPSNADVVVKLIGPSARMVSVPSGQSISINVAAGDYSILVRYGTNPSEFVYVRGGPLRVTETQTQHSIGKIALAKSPEDNADARKEFDVVSLPLAGSSGDTNGANEDIEIRLRYTLPDSYGGSIVAFSSNGGLLAFGTSRVIKLWELSTGREVLTLAGHHGSVDSVVFSSDGRLLASGSSDKTVKLWELSTGREVLTLVGHRAPVESIAFSPDSRLLASEDSEKTVRLWEVGTGREVRIVPGHKSFQWVASVAFSPYGQLLASGRPDRTIKLWDVATGREVRTLTGHRKYVDSVAFSPDGHLLASGSNDKTIKLWDVATGRSVRTMTGHLSVVGSVAFSPDGRLLASGSSDKTIKLWDVNTGREVTSLSGHPAGVNSVVFAPGGRWLASSSNHAIKLWEISTEP
jgi:WD40 repeat protein